MLRLLWYFCQLCRCVLIVATTCMTPFFLVCLRKFLHHSRNCFLTSVDWLRIRSRRMKLDARPARSRKIYKRLSKKRPTDSSSSPFCMLRCKDVKQSKGGCLISLLTQAQKVMALSTKTTHAFFLFFFPTDAIKREMNFTIFRRNFNEN